MLTGKWNVVTTSPMGEVKSVWDVTVEGEVLTGTLTDDTGTVEMCDGKMVGDTFDFDATLKLPFGKIKFHFNGKVDGDSIEGASKMSMGQSPFKGTRA